jgi:AAA15 family ATPase/GTPase
MHISHFKVVNFKLFREIKIDFNQAISIMTGVNNSGKTTVLQALSLWHECFIQLIRLAGTSRPNYKKGDYILGNTQEKYFAFDQINSVLSPNFEDIFYQRDQKNKIELSAVISDQKQDIEICFQIGSSGQSYVIELINFRDFNFKSFNNFFKNLPLPFGFFYTSPSAVIQQVEKFVTFPQVAASIINRDSANVIRNRLYLLQRSKNSDLFPQFLENLSFILYNNQKSITIFTSSDIQKDINVVFTFKHNSIDIEKDIALLGSGTLQIIEILLNLHNSERKDLNLILLDEPDSHIHREIQSRLLQVLTKFSEGNQIFLTTHNEALIRSADPAYLFHLDGSATGTYQSLNISLKDLPPRFAGIYPSQVNPLISALGGMVNGLDFLDAIEADKLIFVEGADDAKAIDILLKQRIGVRKKYVYWVLGGISEVWERIVHYKTVFSSIKNHQTLWQKSVLIIDRDFLNDSHQSGMAEQFATRMDLKANVWSSYTFESTLFTDISKLAQLLNKWLVKKSIHPDLTTLEHEIQANYLGLKEELESRYDDKKYENMAYLYQDLRNKSTTIFGYKYITENDTQISTKIRNHISDCLKSGDYFKLMTKNDVEKVITSVLNPYSSDLKPNFIELIGLVDKSTWFKEWDFLMTI